MSEELTAQTFVYLSHILYRKIYGAGGELAGEVRDLVANVLEQYPVVTDIVMTTKERGKIAFVPWQKFAPQNGHFILNDVPAEQFSARELLDYELLLKDAMLDKQIVDTDGAKVRRVNDLQFLKARDSLHLVHVDVGFRGLMRRVGLERPVLALMHALFDYELPDQFISWKFVQPIASPDLLRLKISQSRLATIHPADLADIIEDLDIYQRRAVFKSLDVETAAETLEETDPKIQVSLIEDMGAAQASDIIEEMSLSEAADLLGDLPRDKAETILKEMEQEVADDVKELLVHHDETAGGLMTTAFLNFYASVTAGEALETLRREAEEMEMIYYIYVIDLAEHLLGVVSIRELLAAGPEIPLSDIMDTRIVAVGIEEEKEQIADTFAKYGVMAVPVVDDENRIKGVIDFKNLLEIVAPQLGK
jgi:magnesium transporter